MKSLLPIIASQGPQDQKQTLPEPLSCTFASRRFAELKADPDRFILFTHCLVFCHSVVVSRRDTVTSVTSHICVTVTITNISHSAWHGKNSSPTRMRYEHIYCTSELFEQ